ncbi:hypothetical protein M8J76_011086 [Diaphorina citri]|nr:hypothetical protein M8J76_011086 [Diaphorina citri]
MEPTSTPCKHPYPITPPLALHTPPLALLIPPLALHIPPLALHTPPLALLIPPLALHIPPLALYTPPLALLIPPLALYTLPMDLYTLTPSAHIEMLSTQTTMESWDSFFRNSAAGASSTTAYSPPPSLALPGKNHVPLSALGPYLGATGGLPAIGGQVTEKVIDDHLAVQGIIRSYQA